MEAIQFDTISVDVSTGNFLIRGEVEARGDLMVFLNDHNRSSFPIRDAKFMPDGPEYKVPPMQQPNFTVSQEHVAFVAVIKDTAVEKIQFVNSSRTVVFYTNWFAIRGELHVSSEARDDELLDPTKEFFAVTDVAIYPIRQMTNKPQRRYPLVAIQRSGIVGYHVYQNGNEE